MYHRRRFACRDRRRTADSKDAPGGVLFRQRLLWRRFLPRPSIRQDPDRCCALASTLFDPTLRCRLLAASVGMIGASLLVHILRDGSPKSSACVDRGPGRHIVMPLIPRNADKVGIV